tara:strand:- start:9720 stop:10532 length:813 start_codon:yes stop_codon:yes gene_type:complete
MAVYLPADRRFRRAQIKPVRRKRNKELRRNVLNVLLLLILVMGGLRAAPLIVHDVSMFRIDNISISGNQYLSNGEILSLVSEFQDKNIFKVNLNLGREHLLASSWVKTATLRRVFPSTIEINIKERLPIGLARFDALLYLIDSEGIVIEEYGPAFSSFKLPIVDGLQIGAKNNEVDSGRASLLVDVIKQLESESVLANRVSQIDVSNPHNVVVLLNDDSTFLHLGTDRYAERIDEYLELLPTIRARVNDIDYVDMRFDQRVYVRPAESLN